MKPAKHPPQNKPDAARLRDFIRRQPKDTQATLRRVLREQGLLAEQDEGKGNAP